MFVSVCGLVAVFGLWMLVKVFQLYNSPDGERYRKLRMQGPFVPLSTEEIEADRRRAEGRTGLR
jgi:hypothetical protein